MPKALKEDDLAAIEQVVRAHPEGISVAEITGALKPAVARRTLQYRLKFLADAGRIAAEGEGRGVKYRIPPPKKAPAQAAPVPAAEAEEGVPLSAASKKTRQYLSQPVTAR